MVFQLKNQFLKPEEIISNSKTLKAKFSLIKESNKRTLNLDLCFDALKSSSVIFSISGNFLSKMRTRLCNRSVLK